MKNLAKFRRDLVLKNLFDNEFLTLMKNHQKFKKQKIELKKNKKNFLEDAQYYIEDVRKKIIENSLMIKFIIKVLI